MAYYLSENIVLKWLESPSLYNIQRDELYELDRESFEFLMDCVDGTEACTDLSFLKYCLNEEILSERPRKTEHPPISRSPVPSLRYLELQITNRCNLLCKHCYIDDKDPAELSIDEITSILREFEEMQGLRVLVTGGEPLVYTRFKELNNILPRFSVRKILLSNGLLLNKEIIKELNFEEVQISIDGLEDSHDSIRGKGTFKRSMDSIRLIKEAGLDVSVATIIHPKNLDDLDKLEKILIDMDVKTWSVDIPCNQGRLRSNKKLVLSPEEGSKYFRYGFGDDLHYTISGFGCGLHLMAVTANGDVAKCTFYREKKVGTIKEGLRQCWQRIRPIRIEELSCDCEYIEDCRGGCRYRAEILTGDPMGKDLYRCSYYMKKSQ